MPAWAPPPCARRALASFRSARVGAVFEPSRSEASGQAGAFRQVGATKLAVFSVVNALGVIVDRQGRVVRGNLDAVTGERRVPLVEVERRLATGAPLTMPTGNTTLTVVVTNQQLSARALTQVARQVHAAMARIIQPFHTPLDGDVLYAVTTNAVEQTTLTPIALGLMASELLWDAILSMVRIVEGAP
jgi:L-aminopeptidase/D-esterase-like protein